VPSVPPCLLIAGPTASGKSALALAVAEHLHGAIINADSMQVYHELRILTARPTPQEEARVAHLLYGVRPAAEPSDAAWWRTEALHAIETTRAQGRLPILCGGTGLYFAALTGGLAQIPEIPPPIRAEVRALLSDLGAAGLHARLSQTDPATAARLQLTDSQRIARAWEVWRATGISLTAWQSATPLTAHNHTFRAILLDPPRDRLRAAIERRFKKMLAQGALEEVRELLELGLDPALPAMRAHGVAELSAHLRGEISLAEAEHRTVLASGQYTKRQATWFRHHRLAADTFTIHARFDDPAQLYDPNMADLMHFVGAPG
jgi:tRNA dimethylallyltransferase